MIQWLGGWDFPEQPPLGLSLLYPDILILGAHSNLIQWYKMIYDIYVPIDLYIYIDLQYTIFQNSIHTSLFFGGHSYNMISTWPQLNRWWATCPWGSVGWWIGGVVCCLLVFLPSWKWKIDPSPWQLPFKYGQLNHKKNMMMGERGFGSESHEDEVWGDFLIKTKHELEAFQSFFLQGRDHENRSFP